MQSWDGRGLLPGWTEPGVVAGEQPPCGPCGAARGSVYGFPVDAFHPA